VRCCATPAAFSERFNLFIHHFAMGDAHDITQYLLKLASSLAASQQPLKAIKCLEAVLRQSLLPTLEVQTRLQAARLLLDHTDCLAPAREHLQKAVSACQQRSGSAEPCSRLQQLQVTGSYHCMRPH
jgi:hypothetical protein